MKKIFQFSLIFFLLSCNVRNNVTIDYIFPLNVEKKLKEKISQHGNKTDYFVIFKNGKPYNELILVDVDNVNDELYGFYNVKSSNYRVLIDKNLYSLVFYTDLKYALKFCDNDYNSLDERLMQQSMEDGLCMKKPSISIYHNAFVIKFDDNGIVLD